MRPWDNRTMGPEEATDHGLQTTDIGCTRWALEVIGPQGDNATGRGIARNSEEEGLEIMRPVFGRCGVVQWARRGTCAVIVTVPGPLITLRSISDLTHADHSQIGTVSLLFCFP